MRLLVLITLLSLSANGASFFVRTNAVGSHDGSDWNNAWAGSAITWASVSAGDTLYFAGGAYAAAIQWGKSGTTGNPITLKRVQSSDSAATSAAGWDSSFDSQVVIMNTNASANTFSGLKWAGGLGSYVIVDGRITNGWKFSTVDQTDTAYWQAPIEIWISTTATNIVLTNLEFTTFSNCPSGCKFINASTGIYCGTGSFQSITNVVVTHCSFHDMVQAIQTGTAWQDWTIEYCGFWNTYPLTPDSFPIQHDNIVWAAQATNVVFRYNQIWNWATEGLLLTSTSGNTGNGRWDIYDNVWHDGTVAGTSRVMENGTATNGPIYFYNNTIANTGFGIRDSGSVLWVSGSQGRNNIYWNISSTVTTLPDNDYDFISTSNSETHGQTGPNPFMGGTDYRLKLGATAIDTGTALGSPYDVDFLGITRPQGPAWDIGAYEFVGHANIITGGSVLRNAVLQ